MNYTLEDGRETGRAGIWHSGNLNNVSIDFKAKNIGIGVANPQAGIDIFKSYDTNIPKAIKIMYQGSWVLHNMQLIIDL